MNIQQEIVAKIMSTNSATTNQTPQIKCVIQQKIISQFSPCYVEKPKHCKCAILPMWSIRSWTLPLAILSIQSTLLKLLQFNFLGSKLSVTTLTGRISRCIGSIRWTILKSLQDRDSVLNLRETQSHPHLCVTHDYIG